jgi:8-oxo-dGTP diphosphatase
MLRRAVLLTTLCYIRSKGRTLMLHRVKKAHDVNKGKWNGLGGKFENGETPEQCAIREVKEESGFTIRNPILRGILTYPEFIRGQDEYVFLYTATDFEGKLIDDCPEGDLEWIEDNRLLDLNLWEGDRLFLKWIDQKPFFSGCFTYKGEQLMQYQSVFYGQDEVYTLSSLSDKIPSK